jgi:hypothetical protein
MTVIDQRMECFKLALEMTEGRLGGATTEQVRSLAEEIFQFLQQDSLK